MLLGMYRIAGTVLALLWAGGQAQAVAPGDLSQFTFKFAQIEKQPAKIYVSPGYLTVIDFPEAVTTYLSGDKKLLKDTKSGNQLFLTAAKTAGQTDLVVTSGGRLALFVVQIDGQGKTPRRYTVTDVAAPLPAPSAVQATPQKVPVAQLPGTQLPGTQLPGTQVAGTQVAGAPASTAARRPTTVLGAGILGRYEAEHAVIYRSNALLLPDSSGGQIVEHINDPQSRVVFPAVRAPTVGRYVLRIRYTNGNNGVATQALSVNGVDAGMVQYPFSGAWEKFGIAEVAVDLKAGVNNVRFGLGQGVATLDVIELLASDVAAPAPLVAVASPAATAPAAPGNRTPIGLSNPGFESDAASWSGWWDIKLREVSSATIGTKDPHSGGKYLKLGSDQTFKQNILQTVTGLANGRYTLEMWVRTSGGQNDLTLFALDYGGKELNLSIPKAQNLSWVKYTLPNINVTNGKATIGIWENAPAGLHYADVDDVALYREDATSP